MAEINLIDRSCPLCKSNSFEVLITIDPELFIDINPSLNREVIKNSGLLNLEHISIVRCKECDFVYTNKYLDDAGMSILYGQVIDAETSKNKIYKNSKIVNYLNLAAELLNSVFKNRLEESTTINLIEIGAGWGDFLQIIKGPGINVLGVEYDERKRSFMDENHIPNVKILDHLNVDYKFNMIFSNAVFEHLVNPVEEMERVDKFLSHDFIGLIAVPNYSQERLEKNLRPFREKNPIDKNISTWEHVNYFSPEKLWDFLNIFDYEVFDIKTGGKKKRGEMTDTIAYFRRKT